MDLFDIQRIRPKALREPSRAWVRWPECADLHGAWCDVYAANHYVAERRGWKPLEPSAMEVWLLAAYLYYGMEPIPQFELGPYVADFYFEDADLVVEVDGREWHKDKARDQRRDDYMRSRGTGVRRFFGSEVYYDPLRCARHTSWDIQDRLPKAA